MAAPTSGPLGTEDLARMRHIEEEVSKLLLQYRDNTEAALVAGALFRICRTLLRLYPERVQAELIEGAVGWLKGQEPEADNDPRLVLPPHFGGRVQ